MNRTILTFAFIIFTQSILADEWPEPKIIRYFSINGTYRLTVFPTQIPEKYYQWKSAKQNERMKYYPSDTTIIYCHATLYKIINADSLEIWDRRLINKVMPVDVIIADDGKSIVTFDDWYSAGYGLNVMVTYTQNGELIKRYQLKDIWPFPINNYDKTITSILWRHSVKYINNETIEICFQDENQSINKRNYNLTTKEFE